MNSFAKTIFTIAPILIAVIGIVGCDGSKKTPSSSNPSDRPSGQTAGNPSVTSLGASVWVSETELSDAALETLHRMNQRTLAFGEQMPQNQHHQANRTLRYSTHCIDGGEIQYLVGMDMANTRFTSSSANVELKVRSKHQNCDEDGLYSHGYLDLEVKTFIAFNPSTGDLNQMRISVSHFGDLEGYEENDAIDLTIEYRDLSITYNMDKQFLDFFIELSKTAEAFEPDPEFLSAAQIHLQRFLDQSSCSGTLRINGETANCKILIDNDLENPLLSPLN